MSIPNRWTVVKFEDGAPWYLGARLRRRPDGTKTGQPEYFWTQTREMALHYHDSSRASLAAWKYNVEYETSCACVLGWSS
jgi:hypothetical protein